MTKVNAIKHHATTKTYHIVNTVTSSTFRMITRLSMKALFNLLGTEYSIQVVS